MEPIILAIRGPAPVHDSTNELLAGPARYPNQTAATVTANPLAPRTKPRLYPRTRAASNPTPSIRSSTGSITP